MARRREEMSYFFACSSCFSLDPCIIIEISGKNSKCEWCSKSEKVFLCELPAFNKKYTTQFVKYEVVKPKNTQRKAVYLCKRLLELGECHFGDECFFAHNTCEATVWRKEIEDPKFSREKFTAKTKDLRKIAGTRTGCFYCSACLLCFENQDLYIAHLLHDIHSTSYNAIKYEGWIKNATNAMANLQTGDAYLVGELEKKYICPENIMDVTLDINQNLRQTEYVDFMHTFLYQEEFKRKETLAKLDGSYQVEKCGSFENHDGDWVYGEFVKISMEESLFVVLDEVELLHRNCKLVEVHLKKTLIKGRFKSLCEQNLYLDISGSNWRDEFPTEPVQVKFVFDRELFCKFHYALDCLGTRVGFICPREDSFCRLAFTNIRKDRRTDLNKLDNKQVAVMKHLDADKDRGIQHSNFFPPLVIAGPFGTGKSYTLSVAIHHILKNNGKNTRILLCTHSNSAADLYITSDYAKKNLARFRILRVYYHKRLLATVHENVRKFCIFNDDNSAFRYPNFKEILSHNLIICTFATSQQLGALGAGSRSGMFTHIFLDEASQALEPEVLIPITLATESTKIVIAGDHKQLTEKAFSRESGNQPATFMERMYKSYENGNKQSRIFFSNNYRTVKPILDVISRISYSGVNLTSRSNLSPIDDFKAIQFHHVDDECSKTKGGDFVNLSEVNKIVEIVQDISNKKVVNLKKIAVVTCYRSQVAYLRFELRKVGMRNVCVDTINNVQGMEFDIVIVSCVLTKLVALSLRGENLGVLSNPRLLNTSLTRAKRAVIAIGDTVTVSSVGSKESKRNWRMYLEECDKLEGIFPPTLKIINIQQRIQLDIVLNPTAVEFRPGTNFKLRNVHEMEAGAKIDVETSVDEEDWISDSDDDDPNVDYILQGQIEPPMDFDEENMEMPVIGTNRAHPRRVHSGEDPNEPNNYERPSSTPLFKVYTREQLKKNLDKEPDKYIKCQMEYTTWDEACLTPTCGEKSFVLSGRNNLGRTFDDDLVVVCKELDEKGQLRKKVIGVLQSARNKDGKLYLCQPDENSSTLLTPINKSITKFIVVRKKEHRTLKDSIPIYKPRDKNDCDWRKFELVNHVKMDTNQNFLYVVKYYGWMNYCSYPFGYVVKTINASNTKQYLETMFCVPRPYPKSVKYTVTKLKRTNVKNIKEEFVFTIDPPNSVDLDDAVSIKCCSNKQHKDCFEIGIHITDVASKIGSDTPLDKQARKRGTTYYSADAEPTHMLPKQFINDHLTLFPDKIRNAISIFLHSSELPNLTTQQFFNGNGKMKNLPIPKLTTITSKLRLTYKEAEDLLDEPTKEQQHGTSIPDIAGKLKMLWKIFWNQRLIRLGGTAFSGSTEYEGILEAGKAHLLIEEVMITYNTCIAHYLIEQKRIIPLRVQDSPSLAHLEDWQQIFSKDISTAVDLCSFSLFQKLIQARENDRNENSSDLLEEFFDHLNESNDFTLIETKTKKKKNQKVLKEVYDGEVEMQKHFDAKLSIAVQKSVWEKIMALVKSGDTLKAMLLWGNSEMQQHFQPVCDRLIEMKQPAQMIGSSRNDNTISHSSLQLQFYAWASSPIRRYVDIVIQRNIHDVINPSSIPSCSDANYVDTICAQLTSTTKRANQFEKESAVLNYGKSLSEEQRQIMVSVIGITEEFIQTTSQECKSDVFATKAEHLRIRFCDLDSTQQMPNILCTNKRNETLFSLAYMEWKFRFYDYGKKERLYEDQKYIRRNTLKLERWEEEVFGFNIPREIWCELTKDIVVKNRRSVENFRRSLITMDEIKSEAVKKESYKTCFTHNDPIVLPHKRLVKFPLSPGDQLKVQLCGQRTRINMILPSVQLVWITDKYHICVQHRSHPTSTFALEALSIHPCRNVHRYVSLWEPVLRLDAVVCAVKEQHSFTLSGVTVEWNEIKQQKSFVEEVDKESEDVMHRVRLEYNYCAERYIRFSPADVICLKRNGVTETGKHVTQVLHGILRECNESNTRNRVDLHFTICSGENRFPGGRVQESDWIMEVIPIGVPFGQMYKSLKQLKYFSEGEAEELIKQIIFGTITPSVLPFDEITEESVNLHCTKIRNGDVLQGFGIPLNKKQAEEVEKALRQNFTIIQGPPGTGKSFMGGQLAVHYAQINKFVCEKKVEQKERVLYCGPSNKSVDVVAGYLLNVVGIKTVRVYSKRLEEEDYPNPLKPTEIDARENSRSKLNGNSHQALHHLIRKQSTFSDEINEMDAKIRDSSRRFTRKELDRYSAMIMKAKEEILQEADIIICTCGFSGLLKKIKDLTFRQCIIDECAMCTEPEVLVPLVLSKPQQIVFIGDHMQLEPVVTCKEAERLGLGISLFSRLHDYSEMLEVQYRMHSKICEFPSNYFYNGKLKSDPSNENLATVFRQPVMFLNVNGIEKVKVTKDDEGGEHSKFNIAEINNVLALLRRMMTSSNMEPTQVMVLSPYTAQCNKIKKRLQQDVNPKMRQIKVGTIVTSQGDQCDYVVFSTVRSQIEIPTGNTGSMSWQSKFLGFLANQHQVNVALTRAKRGLCIIGNSQLLSKNDMWYTLIRNLSNGAMQNDVNRILR